MDNNTRALLINGLHEIDPVLAEVLDNPRTKIERVESSLLKTFAIYFLFKLEGFHPLKCYVGANKAGKVFLLSGNPSAFVEMIDQERIKLENDQAAADYFSLFLLVTEYTGTYYYVVNSAADVRFAPELDETEQEVKADFIKRYTPIIRPPVAKFKDDEFIVNSYVIEENALELRTGFISPAGVIIIEKKVLEENLPLVIYL